MSSNWLSFLFPNVCPVCNRVLPSKRYVCTKCESALYYIGRNSGCKTCFAPILPGEQSCGRCILKPPHYKAIYSAVYFKGAIRTALHRYKFRNRPDLHTSFSAMIIRRLEEVGCTDFDVVVPIPLSKERYRERGYNQSALIAKDIAKHFGVPYNMEAFFRKKHTERQSALAHQYRDANVRGAFALQSCEGLSEKHVLLVDDIFTTGATLREASRILSKAGCTITAATVAAACHTDTISRDAKIK